jgi:uroporphyrinogen III methyltransferase/synthase
MTMGLDKGTVYLVGAGPWDPGLITVKGLACIREADVILFDYLANERLLNHARPDAEIVYVGKKGGERGEKKQARITEQLIRKAREGKSVVRMKGGDPTFFGRGAEEAEALVEAGVPFEIVPGVTAGIAAPAYAGIPVTHRDFSSMFTAVPGHEDPTKEESAVDWHALAALPGTIVFYMGARRIGEIAQKLIECGKSPETPVAAIRWGTSAEQRTLVATLAEIGDKARDANLEPPVLTVIGDVVRLREKLAWFEKKPLFGRRVLVTRARAQASELTERLESLGAAVTEMPVIEIVPADDYGLLDDAISQIDGFDWIIFTSVNAVAHFFGRLRATGGDARRLKGVDICAIGPATRERLLQEGVLPDLCPPKYTTESILSELRKNHSVDGKKILLPRADIAPPALAEGLKELGATVVEAVAYKTIATARDAELVAGRLERGGIDVVTFTSSSTVLNFARALGEAKDRISADIRYASIGPATSATARDAGFPVAWEATEQTIPGLVAAIAAGLSAE